MIPVHYSADIGLRLHSLAMANIDRAALTSVSFDLAGAGGVAFQVYHRGAWHEVSVRPVEVAE